MILLIVDNKCSRDHLTAPLATIFSGRTIPGCIELLTIGINIKGTGAALPIYVPFRATIGSITMVGLHNGTTRRRPSTTGSILLPVPGGLEVDMSRRISVVISEPIRMPLPMVHGMTHLLAPVLSHTGFTTGFIGP